MVPFLGLSYVLANYYVSRGLTRVAEERLETEARLISNGIREWGQETNFSLAVLSKAIAEDVSNRRVEKLQTVVDALGESYPYRHWAVFSAGPSPKLLAGSDEITKRAEIKAKVEESLQGRESFEKVMRGEYSYTVERFFHGKTVCMTTGYPIYSTPSGSTGSTPTTEAPVGAIYSCLPLQFLSDEAGLKQVLTDSQSVISGAKGTQQALDEIGTSRTIDSSFMLISKTGDIIYPVTTDASKVFSKQDYLKGVWAPLFLQPKWPPYITSGKVESVLDHVTINGQPYFVSINNADETWTAVMVLNQHVVFAERDRLMHLLAALGMGGLLLSCVVIYQQCDRIIKPLRKAEAALQLISDGNFETRIEHDRDDELGVLLDNVNRTSSQLKIFLAEEKKGAVTRRQLQTAREIQKDFLIKKIPEPEGMEIQAVSYPAQEIGADWYDGISINNVTYLVVADVCDKGIPSALYMSVFRSLLRYSLLREHDSSDPKTIMLETMKEVNDYMARNHQDSMMFATVFLAALCPSRREFHYVSAGHEPCIIQRGAEQILLEATGPAVGIFTTASYTAGSVDLRGGEYLVAYSDGLVDAHSPTGEGWGRPALLNHLQTISPQDLSAMGLLSSLVETVNQHTSGTEPFDDLTLMVVHVQEAAQAS
ncbi:MULTISPECIES: PP2C family protein-serine/threonine phosphatase [Aphanothece]|uniref:PP2C family protein-serine/threonine phosphatase n=1 Tax=Aphanothece TaxID=1121 RepID=UPI003984B495